jgi:hypothetical protein
MLYNRSISEGHSKFFFFTRKMIAVYSYCLISRDISTYVERPYLINTVHIFTLLAFWAENTQKIRGDVELNVSVHSFFCHPTESFTRSQDCMTERKPIVIQKQKKKFCILFTNRTFVFPLNLNWSIFSIKG